MKRRLATGTAVAAGLVLSLTGCLGSGGDDKAGGAKAVVLAAAAVRDTSAKTSQVQSVKGEIQTEVTAPGVSDPVTMHMRMEAKLRPEPAYRITIDSMNMGGKSMAGQADGMEMVLLGHTIYMKSPMFAQLTHGKPWVRLSTTDLGGAVGQNFDKLLQQQKQADPTEQVKQLTASKDVHEVGKETLNGVQTTHYQGTVSVQEMLAKLPEAQRQQRQQSFQKLGVQSLAFDLWVDGKQLPAKIVMKTPDDASSKMNTTVTYTGWNLPVQVSAPPAAQVGKMPSLLTHGAPGD
ncbi:DUF6612 family protein [Actinomadura rupiterrae]|uniref:DUF6612 family protein n=1 Tax=Actinomadura rupiterrae TaxID=559627 RepID=UPI0020A4E1E4|nr:DUF6612 family protein [Actinomadura rupiterrae]MCP2343355.1 hypothetical protein [Actinomadura rupiterrae]